ncbi:hypothetical protein Q664_37385 [Archangium violaceum Cb vi76]|uniref:DUF1521 domain-containing protein n=2 Tax=Archangium violaceum TaxID=83451 RepID=A0A084SKP9_9BACT|nr:hypothetical protein Q664_37385 [Archangium violaceum Cb vi76]
MGMGAGRSIGPSPFANQRCLNRAEAQLVRAMANALKALGSRAHGGRGDCFRPPQPPVDKCGTMPRPCHTSPPRPQDGCHPQGTLKTDGQGVVTTPGGYKIEATKQHEWIITGPDGKNTRVWGDPHVAEGDGGKWDFKRDSTFVLGDGTRINCSTAPYGNGATVSSKLEIISGNDRVQITGIDKGKGKTGTVTQDGYAHANSFGGKDVFVMGRETDDWSFKGQEVIGSNNGGESFQLGGNLAAGNTPPTRGHRGSQAASGGAILPGEPNPATGGSQQPYANQFQQLFQNLSQLFSQLAQMSGNMGGCHVGSNHLSAPGQEGPWLDRREQHLRKSFHDMGQMMDAFTRMNDLRQSIHSHRGNFHV